MIRLRGREGIDWASLRGATYMTTATNVIILAGGALAGVISARALGPTGRGQLTVATLWPALIFTIGSLGMQNSCAYHFARWPARRAALVRWLRRGVVLQAIAMTGVSAVIFGMLRLDLRLDPLLALEYSTWAAAAAITLYGVCCAQGAHEFARLNAIRLIPGAAPTVLMLVGVVTVRLTPAEAGAAYVIPVWCSALLAGKWLYSIGQNGDSAEPLTREQRHAVWSYGWRSAASLSGLTLNQSADQLTLGVLVPASALGIYSAAAAASSPLPSLVSSLGMVGLPTVAALTGKAKSAATWRTMLRAARSLVLVAPVLALLLPWAIPLVYGASYSAAVVPSEFLLLGTVFAAFAVVTDDLLRAHGHPGFVSISQGLGGAVTAIGTVALGGHPLSAVAAVSSLGYALAFALALARLRVATSVPGRHRAPRRARVVKSDVGLRRVTVSGRIADHLAQPHHGFRWSSPRSGPDVRSPKL